MAKPRKPRTASHYGTPGASIQGLERARIIDWIREGKTRNEIRDLSGRSGSTISGIAKAEGLEFAERSRVDAATRARAVDMRGRRAEVKAALLEDAMRLRGQLWQPCVVFNIGGKENVYTEHAVPEPPAADKLKLMQAAAAALGRHMDLDQHDADEKAANARSMLTELGKALGVKHPDA